MKLKILLGLSLLALSVSLFFNFQRPKSTPLSLELKKRIESVTKKPAVSLEKLAKTQSEAAIGQLVQRLKSSLDSKSGQSLKEINEALKMANELIEKEPDAYSSHKAKLILLLTKESKFDQTIDEEELEDNLKELASFDILSDETLKKEAFVIARTNSELRTLEADIGDLEDEVFEIDEELDFLELELESLEDDDEVGDLENEFDDLLDIQDEIQDELDNLNQQADELEEELEVGVLNESEYLDEYVVEVPLYRSLAKQDYDKAIYEAETLLDEYPDSVAGHFFLIKALELKGENEEALSVIEDTDLPEELLTELQNRLRRSENTSPENYWMRLR